MIHPPSIFPDQGSLAAGAAAHIARSLRDSMGSSSIATLVLSGGKTPRVVYEILAGQEVDWARVHLFWGDERNVAPDHPDSNFRMAHEALLSKVNVPPENVHRVRCEQPPLAAAEEYDGEIRTFFGTGDAPPGFDVLLLGLGPDGHIASIFPGTPAETETERFVTAVHVAQLRSDRVTMTFPVLNNAREICLLVSGSDKAAVVKAAFAPEDQVLPVHRLKPVRGRVRWFLDRSAAGLINERENE